MKLRIGTRGSKLALWQADFVKSELLKKLPSLKIEIIPIKTTGDLNLESDLSEIGGKGVFVKEIELALLNDEIDIAVHSLKDVPSILPDGLTIGSVLKRHNPFDVFVSKNSMILENLPPEAKIATGSLRRKFQLLSSFPQLNVVSIRGNIDTRLKKIDSENLDGIILAAAGLERLGLTSKITHTFTLEQMVPSPCQGIIGIECRKDDIEVLDYISKIEDKNTRICADLERSFLKTFGGDCSVPLGCYSAIENQIITASAIFIDSEEKRLFKRKVAGNVSEYENLGVGLANYLIQDYEKE